jgi:DNA-binding beta-propeller fold protein YncE
MKRLFFAIVLSAVLCCFASAQGQQAIQLLKLVQKIPLPGVQGRIDHLSVDVKGKRLFMAGLGNGTVEVIDLVAGKLLYTIPGLKDPQGVLYVPESNLIFVTDGELNLCNVYDGASYKLIRSETSLKDADNVRYDPWSLKTYGAGVVDVAYGSDTNGGLRVLDSRDGKPLFEIPLEAKPESFQMEKTTGRRIFVNIPTKGYIAVAEPGRRIVTDKWPVQGFKPFYPMALDEKNQRLFIGSREPAALVIFDTKTGRMVTSVEAVAHTDDLFYDAVRKRIYMSSGEGVVAVFEQSDADHYQLVAKIPSVPGAGTSLFVPDFNRLYVPAPPYGGQPATVLVYDAQP